jgi:hypothetical protein
VGITALPIASFITIIYQFIIIFNFYLNVYYTINTATGRYSNKVATQLSS